MRRETQNVLLVLLGGALLKIALNGDYLRYVRPAQQPWILGGGFVILALGVVAMVRDMLAAAGSRKRVAHPVGHHHPARTAWLLMVPVLAVFLVAPPALGSDSVARSRERAPQGSEARPAIAFPPLPPGEVVPLPVSDFVTRAGWDDTGTLDGRTVSITGFVVHDERGTSLARLVIGCCAADAYPVTVRLPAGVAETMPSDTWVEVTGALVPESANRANRYTPELTVRTVRAIAAPPDPYEY